MSNILSGSLVVGMRAPFATVQLRFGTTDGVDFSTAVLSLAVSIVGPSGTIAVGPGSWVWSDKTATSAKATWSPAGTEFTAPGYHTFSGTLTVDGSPLDLASFDAFVEHN